jgi:hypothetical protein
MPMKKIPRNSFEKEKVGLYPFINLQKYDKYLLKIAIVLETFFVYLTNFRHAHISL